jgi:mannosylglycoprotein endo-beta-mannosidase
MEAAIQQRCPSQYAKHLEAPITYEEITTALKTGARHKAPGTDGISLEFYTQNWDIIKADLKELLNQMFSHNKVSAQQKHAIIINLPKANGEPTPEGYRPISLLTTEYKILARIMAQRLRPIMQEQLSSC